MKKIIGLSGDCVILFGTDPDPASPTVGAGVALKKKLLTHEEKLEIEALKKAIALAPASQYGAAHAALDAYVQSIEV